MSLRHILFSLRYSFMYGKMTAKHECEVSQLHLIRSLNGGSMRRKKDSTESINANQKFIHLLFVDYRKLVFSRLNNRLTDPLTIEDLSQEVYIRLICNVDSLLKLEKPALVSYICQTTESIIIDWMRKNVTTYEFLSLEELDDCPEPLNSSVELIVLDRIDAEVVRVLMEQLDEIDQNLLVGYYFMHYTAKELSEIYQCSESNINTRMSRARKRLLHLYKMRGDESNEQ